MPSAAVHDAAAMMYDLPEVEGFANWNEGAAAPGEIVLDTPRGWEDTPATAADRREVADAMAAAGASKSLARELWADVTAAAVHPVATTQADAWRDLRQTWGRQTDAKIGVARAAIAEMQAKYPGTNEYLRRSGLGNSPAFIRKIVARASRNSRR